MYVINPNRQSDREVADVIGKKGAEYPMIVALKQPDQIALFEKFSAVFAVEKYSESITKEFCEQRIEEGVRIITPDEYRKARVKHLPNVDVRRMPHELVKVSLELMSASLKECLRVASMGLMCDVVQSGEPILSIGGREDRLDTAAVILPGFASDFVDAKVLHIKCAPYDQ